MESTNQSYRFAEVHSGQSPFEDASGRPRVARHVVLLALTALTTTIAGAVMPLQDQIPDEAPFLDQLVLPFVLLFERTAAHDFWPWLSGALFTFTLLVILGAHELGHYFACRYYGIRATLPFFIPAPPVITPFGTFGAVIKIKEPITSRRALFDIGIAGPLAGFAFALPAAFIGLLFAQEAAPPKPGQGMFSDPLLFQIIMKIFHVPTYLAPNPIYWAAWGTMLVTALNLFPVGQLDGGHVLYAVFGRRVHKWVSVAVTAGVAGLALFALATGQPPVYLLWTFVLLFLMKVGHPPVTHEEPLGKARIALAIVALAVFVLCFLPAPVTAN